jgi:alkaline phosphatase D
MHAKTCLLLIFASLPAVATAAKLHPPERVARIAFGSCANTWHVNHAVWKAVLRDEPDAFILLGDNVYADTEDTASMRDKYRQLEGVSGFARLRHAVPLLGTWDDHDYGVNDGGAEYPRRVESQKIFLDFFREPAGSPRRAREGVYDAKIWGPAGRRVQIILLDTRYFRSPLLRGEHGYVPDPDSAKTMLGAAQWAWLEEQLRAPAEVRLIVSSIQVVNEEHRFEKWVNLPRERRRLFDLIRETGATGVIFLSGDRHFAELSKMDAELGYPVYDLTASPLAASFRVNPPDPSRHRVAMMNTGENYGFVTIDWERSDPLIRLEARDTDGEPAFTAKIRLSDLRPSAVDRLPLLLFGKPLFGYSGDGKSGKR